jgi:hypothetical protein
LLQLLGLQLDAELLPATMQCLLMVLALFAGPLAYQLQMQWELRQQQQQQQWFGLKAPSIHSVRDCIVAPITEEWCFRACMVPLLWMEVSG